jgi:Metal binding domain of Ada
MTRSCTPTRPSPAPPARNRSAQNRSARNRSLRDLTKAEVPSSTRYDLQAASRRRLARPAWGLGDPLRPAPHSGLRLHDARMTSPNAASKGYTLLGADRRPHPSATPGMLGGHRRSRIYGRLDCPAALRAIAVGGYLGNRVFFADEPTAVTAGYRPCAVCLPAAYRTWKAGDLAQLPSPDFTRNG